MLYEGLENTYVYDSINRIVDIHRPNGISTYNTYNARNQIVELLSTCDDCEWVVSSYSYVITFGAPQYENEYTYNGESYNPNIESQYLRARYYYVVTATFLTEDSYLGNITEPLTINRYIYCVANPLSYIDHSGHTKLSDVLPSAGITELWMPKKRTSYEVYQDIRERVLGITDNSSKYSQIEDIINSTKPSYGSGSPLYSIAEGGYYQLEGYNYRLVRSSSTVLSQHSYGAAIDINASFNQQYITPTDSAFKIDPNGSIVRIFSEHGWYWGREFSGTELDWMHFSLTEEGANSRLK